jgi:excisionase family DNA binding protein
MIPQIAFSDRVVLTVAEVCALTNMGQTTVYKLIKSGALPAFRRRRAYRITRVDLDAYLKAIPRVSRREDVGGGELKDEMSPIDGHF